MPLKMEGSLLTSSQASHPLETYLNLEPTETKPYITVPSTHRQSSLHAHPSRVYQSQPPITTSLPKTKGTLGSKDPATVSKTSRPILNINTTLEQRNSRRSQLTSQDTVIVNPKLRAQRINASGRQAEAFRIDTLKREAERKYYEQHDGNGILRRRSMMRTVSKEDYLLGRGANPRTGLITPGGSIDSNIEDEEIAPTGNFTTQPAKWRQKGDQWVSLDIDEPTPIASPPAGPASLLTKVRRPKTPERFTQWNASVPRFGATAHRHTRTSGSHPMLNMHRQEVPSKQVNNTTSGIQPTGLDDKSVVKPKDQQGREQVIKRKPVAAPPSEKKLSLTPTLPKIPVSLDQGLIPDLPQIGLRSLSAPNTPRQPTSITAVDKVLPNIPIQTQVPDEMLKRDRMSAKEKAFLGVRSRTLTNLDRRVGSSPVVCGKSLDKELPCLPTNNGQYQPAQSFDIPKVRNHSKEAEEARLNTKTQQQHRLARRISSTTANHRSHIAEMAVYHRKVKQSKSSNWTTNQGVTAVPDYDNPPRDQVIRRVRPSVGGPRTMPPPRHTKRQRPVVTTIFNDPFNTTTTNITTSALIRSDLGPYPTPYTYLPPQAWPPPTTPLPPRPHVSPPTPVLTTKAVPLDHQLPIEMALSNGSPQTTRRPAMPSRTAGMRQIPKMNNLERGNEEIHMAQFSPLNSTGMLENGLPKEESPIMPTITNPPRMLHPTGKSPRQYIDVHTENNAPLLNPCPTRRCSRCRSGQVTNNRYSIDGPMVVERYSKLSTNSAHAPEVISITPTSIPITDVTEPILPQTPLASPVPLSTTSANILNVEDDLRDHSICCPDCCLLGCHEGCLGHPSPCPSPSKSDISDNRLQLRKTRSSFTLGSAPSVSQTTEEEEETPRVKFSFIRSAFRIPFWPRGVGSSSSKSNNSSLREDSLQHESYARIQKALTIVEAENSTRNAVIAAKKAIGIDSLNGIDHGLNQLIVAKKRSKRKSQPSKVTSTEVPNALTPPPTPPALKPSITANERRKISASRPCSVNQLSVILHPSQNRNLSGASADVCIPAMDNFGLMTLSELLFIVPYDAMQMWLKSNPQVLQFGWSALDCGWSMGCVIAATARLLLNTLYIYSKTGKLKVKDINGTRIGSQQLIQEVMKSALFLILLTTFTVILSRTLSFLLLPFRVVLVLCRTLLGGRKHSIE